MNAILRDAPLRKLFRFLSAFAISCCSVQCVLNSFLCSQSHFLFVRGIQSSFIWFGALLLYEFSDYFGKFHSDANQCDSGSTHYFLHIRVIFLFKAFLFRIKTKNSISSFLKMFLFPIDP